MEHNISVEFPAQPSYMSVKVGYTEDSASAPECDVLLVGGGSLSASSGLEGFSSQSFSCGSSDFLLCSIGELRLVVGNLATADAPALLEQTFWQETSASWIYILTPDGICKDFPEAGFVNGLWVAFGSSAPDAPVLYAGSNVWDRISSLAASPLAFTVRIREDAK